MEQLTVQFVNAMLYDKLRILSVEYNLSTDQLVNLAVKRLLDDVEFVRSLRVGKVIAE